MANEKVYSIRINGITQSIDAVEALKKQLDALDAKLIELENRKIDIQGKVEVVENIVNSTTKTSSSSASSTKGVLTEDVALQKELNKLKNEGVQLDAKIAASQDEIYKKVQATKDLYKEAIADQKTMAAQERLTANAYSNTMQGMKDKLADLKTAINTTDLGDSDAIKRMTQEANELTNKLKEMEEAYGQFGRNVGNYQDAIDGSTASTDKLKVQVGNTTREFDNAKQALRTMTNELQVLEVQGKRDTTEANNLRKAIYNLQSSMKDATVSSKAMDTAMDWMQSFAAIGSAGKGLKTFFGFENGEIAKNIQDLVALQGVLQGVENIRKQMETKEGVGKLLGRGFDAVDGWTQKLTAYQRALGMYNKGLLGTVANTKTATLAIKGLSVALKSLMSLGVYLVIEGLSNAVAKLVGTVKDWAKGNADLVSSEKQLNSVLDVINETLQQRLRLNEGLARGGHLNQVEKEIEDEKALADAIAATNAELERRSTMDSNNSTFAQGMQNASAQTGINDFLQNDKGVTTIGGFGEAAKDMDELTKRYEALSKAVEKNEDLFYRDAKSTKVWYMTASDAKDELNHLEQFLAGNMVGAMTKFDLSTDGGRRGLADFVNGILDSNDTLQKSLLLRLPELVSDNEGKFGTALEKYLDYIRQFAAQANSALKEFKFEEMANGILDSADETGRRLAERQRETLRSAWMTMSDEQKVRQFHLYKEAMDAQAKQQKKRMAKLTAGNKAASKAEIDWLSELNRMRIEKMDEGLQKQLAQLEEERRQKIAKIKKDGVHVAELTQAAEELYQKKMLDAREVYAKEMTKLENDMWDNILNAQVEALGKMVDNQDAAFEELKKIQEDEAKDLFDAHNTSYGVQGKNLYSPSTQMSMGFVSALDDQKQNKRLQIEAERKFNYQMKQLEKERSKIGEEEYEERKADFEDELEFTKSITTEMVADYKKLQNLKNEIMRAKQETESASVTKYASSTIDEYTAKVNMLYKTLNVNQESFTKSQKEEIEKQIKDNEELINIFKSLQEGEQEFIANRINNLQEEYDREAKIIEKKYAAQGKIAEAHYVQERLEEEGYNQSLVKTFDERTQAVETYWTRRFDAERKSLKTVSETQKAYEEKRHEQAVNEENRSFNEQLNSQKEFFKKKEDQLKAEQSEEEKVILEKAMKEKLTTQQLQESLTESRKKLDESLIQLQTSASTASEQLTTEHNNKLDELEKEHGNNIFKIDRETIEKKKALNSEYFQDSLQEFAKFNTAISELESVQPVKNSWGFTNWKETNKINTELLQSYEAMIAEVNRKKEELNKAFKAGLLDKSVYNATLTEMDSLVSGIGDKMDKVKGELSLGNQIGTIIQEAEGYVQTLGNSLNQILSTVWSAQDAEYEYYMRQLEKQISAAEKAYNELGEIANQHADNMQDIESKIADAQGDARDRLVERYQAEKAARREALTQQKQAEKEKERLEKQKEKEEEAQRKREHKRQIVQAVINTALATVQGFATQPFVPVGLAMGALAASLGAAQIAIISSQKYAKGGVIQGKSHAEGGVKVLGGRAEVEGGEFITNKYTTTKNVEVLDYINSKHKRLTLDDFVDFYGGKSKVSKNVQSVKTKFASGGIIPSLRSDIEFSDKLASSFEAYSNRPTVVSVVDIIDRTQQVNEVRTMAGLTD